MGNYVYMNDNDYPGYHVEFVVDTVADVANVPTNYAPGSTCIVLEDSSVYILSTGDPEPKQWKKV